MNKINEKNYLLPGTRTCAGCSLSLAYRYVLKALGEKTIVTIPAGCSTLLQGVYPYSTVKIPMINTAFATTASSASGISASLKSQKKDKEYTVLGWAGDGGTADIGIQALSAAAERNDNFIYTCYDNEAYMNTGVQRSGATPKFAMTTTTPTGKTKYKKDMPSIMQAHNIPYISTSTTGYIQDLYDKFIKAKSIQGLRYMHILIPCPPGWGIKTSDIIKLSKLSVETGIFELFEIVNGKKKYTGVTKKLYEGKIKPKPVIEYFKLQSRFKNIDKNYIIKLQNNINKKFKTKE